VASSPPGGIRADHPAILEDGSALRLGDVARAELGAENYAFSATYNGEPTVPMGVFLQPGANALETARAVRAAFEECRPAFPAGMDYAIPYDTTEFVAVSIREVLITLLVATVLVVLVTFLFLQHLRATLIPVAAIPVSLIGTFAGMQLFGFSVNLLTLFGLVLAIGIVVDNAIIVMENVERLMHEKGLKARDAAVQTMGQVTGAVIASTLVLVAVFAPVAFFGGLTGELYRQFAVTIAVSVVISGIVAVTLTPAMCALLLDREPKEVTAPFRLFNRVFDWIRDTFVFGVRLILRHWVIGLVLFGVAIAAALLILNRMPSGLVPQEDQGVAIVVYQLPRASALNRTSRCATNFRVRWCNLTRCPTSPRSPDSTSSPCPCAPTRGPVSSTSLTGGAHRAGSGRRFGCQPDHGHGDGHAGGICHLLRPASHPGDLLDGRDGRVFAGAWGCHDGADRRDARRLSSWPARGQNWSTCGARLTRRCRAFLPRWTGRKPRP
jgi:multidrug efflux pump subunit AcrB